MGSLEARPSLVRWAALASLACLACDEAKPPDDPWSGPTVCTSDIYWEGLNARSATMRPGTDCNACHETEARAPELVFSGTVYPTGHEPDECYGVDKDLGVIVEVTDSRGVVYSIPTNTSGNFHLSRAGAVNGFVFPYTARVIDAAGNTRTMPDPQGEGSCNSCHSEQGANDAPGRIVAPN